MKKTFLLLSCVGMLASCSNDEVIDVAKTTTIGFNTFVNNSSRATDLTTANFTSFDVWGVTTDPDNAATGLTALFNDQQVTKQADGSWTYTPLRYWVVGNDYRFTALAPSGATGITNIVQNLDPAAVIADAQGGLTITFNNQTAAANVDLCYAFAKALNVTATQGAVNLEFSHMLSRVKFTFKNTFAAEGSLIRIQNVKITDATAEATINKVNGETTWSEPNGVFTIPFTNVRNSTMIQNTSFVPGGGTAYVATDHQYIIPLTAETSYQLSFTATLMNYNEIKEEYDVVRAYDHVVDLPTMAYLSNHSYNFIAEINDETIDPEHALRPIEFTASISDWEDFEDNDVTFPDKTE
ncbi:MAG: fimbrillin family protein [Muribaculaceae bacterium]|nr:fimbrillin family protein [Muribaculaceae bacterium]